METRAGSHYQVRDRSCAARLPGVDPSGWTVWQRRACNGRAACRLWSARPQPRLRSVGSTRDRGASCLPARCAEYSSGKWDVSCALRLPGYCSHPDWAACAPDGTHPASSTSASIGKQRDGLVYVLVVTQLPSPAFSPQYVLDVDLHRGSFETVLADEDVEQDPDRWCSCSPGGEEFLQM